MSLINDALKRTENAKLDKLSEAESPPKTPTATYGQPPRKRLLGPMTVVFLLLIGGGLVAYRYWRPGGGPAPRVATAESNTTAPPSVVPTPAEPKTDQWVNPAFKDLTPEAANAIRARVAGALVQQFFNAGNSLNEYATSLGKPMPTGPDVAGSKPPKPPVVQPKPPTAPPARPKPKRILSAVAAGVDPNAFNVNGIMFNGKDSMAIINQGVYRVGQKVSGAVVEKITPSAVIMRLGDKLFWVGM